MLITPLVIIGILLLTGIPYKSYNSGANILTNLLGPATVAFAVPIYKNVNLLKTRIRNLHQHCCWFCSCYCVILYDGSSGRLK